MNATRSFRKNFEDVPDSYRTPSPPPREAIEPLSPGGEEVYHYWPAVQDAYATHGLGLSLGGFSEPHGSSVIEDQHLWVDGDGQARIDSCSPNAARTSTARQSTYDGRRVTTQKEEPQKRDKKGHARSASSMDALATIALATSPTFSQASPTFTQSPWPTYTYATGYQHDYSLEERPSKRAKSEKLPSPQVNQRPSRPATSHVNTLESMQSDAELLLNFAQTQNIYPFRKLTPPQNPQIEQESPPFKRLSASTTVSEENEGPAQNEAQQYVTDPSEHTEGSSVHSHAVDHGPRKNSMQEAGVVMGRSVGPENENHVAEAHNHTIVGLGDQQAKSAPEVADNAGKKPRRIQPTTQAPCAKCNSLQATVGAEDQDGLTSWIGCNGCQKWFHIVCAGFKDSREVRTVDKYICLDCEPAKGSTTYVRTSSRARASIDYAGLNQGMVQSSEETAEHHWLKPIKEGKIKFQPDDFARIRPELLTIEYLEKTDGMKRPTVIPACWNPQFRQQKTEGTCTEEDRETSEPEVVIDAAGNTLTMNNLESRLDGQKEEVLDCGQDLLDMVMPENLTVRRVAELHGVDMPLDVIDVKSQQTAQKWNLKKWADYYESNEEKTIRNVISLEVSQSKLGKLLRRPKIVQDLDLQDDVWPIDLPAKAVQFYCLMSVADCYTDFHIDFGGSSVYYHILKGKKSFFFIPPEEKHLKKYEQWNNSPLQNQTFLGNVTGDCSRVDLSEGDTMLIPSGWIHAVWTPENSLVIGGNFLTRLSYEMQIRVNQIEKDTKTAQKFRYPLFQKVNWYAAIRYLEDDPVPEDILHDFEDDPSYVFLRANPVWHEFGGLEPDAEPGDPFYNARLYSRMEIEGLPALRDYLYRTALIASDFHVDGVTESIRTSVKRSVPKGHGEPMDLIRIFGIWVAWKTGCVLAPDWVRPDSPSLASLARKADNQKKSEHVRTPGERMSSRVQSQLEHARADVSNTLLKAQTSSVEPEAAKEEPKLPKRTPKTSGLGPQRFACDPCRKRRIRCRHRDGEASGPSPDNGKTRTYSSISVEIPRPVPAQSVTSFDGPSSSPQPKTYDSPLSSNLASTTLPPMELNGFDHQASTVQIQTQDLMLAGSSSTKKGRSKACEECRKSKRRCIHDENGKVDPFKAAEPSKPRGPTSTKRAARLSDEVHASVKKSRSHDADTDTILVGQAQSALAEVFNEPTIDEDDDFNALIDPSLRPAIQQLQAAADAVSECAEELHDAAAPDSQTDSDAERSTQTRPTLHVDAHLQPSPQIKVEPLPIALATSSSQISANSLVSPPDSLHNDGNNHSSPTIQPSKPDIYHPTDVNGENGNNSGNDPTSSPSDPLQTPKSAASRHSSRQPKKVERYVPDAGGGASGGGEHGAKQPRSTIACDGKGVKKEPRRGSSSTGISARAESSKSRAGSRRASTSTSVVAAPEALLSHPHNKQASSSPKSDGAGGGSGTGAGTHSVSAVDSETADEESLRLIRLLQEDEFGLRRRAGPGGMKA